ASPAWSSKKVFLRRSRFLGAIMLSPTNRPMHPFERFEAQRGVLRIHVPKPLVLFGQRLHLPRQIVKAAPEGTGNFRNHVPLFPGKSRNCPPLASASAATRSRSSLPPGS